MYSGEYLDIIEVGIQGPPGTGMPAGGLKDEILTKKSDANYDYEWKRFKTVLEKHESINEEELRDGLLWNNTSSDVIQYYDGSIIKTLLYSEGSETDQVLCGSSLPNGNLILKSTSAEEKGSIIIPEFNTPGIIVNDELGHISTISQLPIENLPPHSSSIAEFGVASKELYGHVKIGSSIVVDNGVIDVDINTGKGLEYIGETPNKILEIDDTVVTLSDNQVLLNKTLESPVIHSEDSIVDEYGNELLTFKAVTYAKNNVAVENARVAEGPRIYPVGEDNNIDLILSGKGYGNVKIDDDVVTTNTKFQVLTNKVLTDNVVESIYPREDRVNKLYLPDVTDTLVTLNAAQTLTNKTLTAPKFVNHGYIADSNGNELVVFNSYESAVNDITIENAPESNSPVIKASGDDASIDLVLRAKGAGFVRVDNDVVTTNSANQTLINKTLFEPIVSSLYQNSEKTNKITFPEVSDIVVTLNATQTLTNKTLTAPKFVDNGYIADVGGNELLMFNSHDSAVNTIAVENAASLNPPAIKVVGDDSNIDLVLKAKGAGSVRVNDDVITTNNANQTLSNKTLFEPVISSLYQDSEKNNKIIFPGVSDTVVTLNAVQTLTNKILTEPKFTDYGFIADINGNELIVFNIYDSAVNSIVVENAVEFDSPVIRADGDDINVDLILKAKGAGSVKVDSDIITTNNAVQTLTNKILTTPRIINNDYIADLNGNKLLMFGSVPAAKTYLKLINNTVENDVILEVLGSDNVGLNIIPNGSGNIQINNDVITTNTAKQLLNNKILYKPIISSLYQDPEKINEITFPAISDTVVTLKAEQTLKNKILTTPKIISDDYISDINGNELLMFGSTPSAETYLKLTNNTAGNNTILEALGSMNTGLDIVTSGTGTVRINNDVVTTNAASQTLTHKTLIEPTIGNFVNANHNHSNNVNGGQITDAALSSPVTPAKGGTGFNSYTLGDIIYASSPDTLVKLPGNTTTDTKLLTQTGTGTKSSSPEWKKYKHEQVIGDGISTEYTINHNLNTRAHTISIWRNIPPYDEIDYYVEKTTLNTITLYFDRVLQQDEFSVVIIG